MREYVNSLIVIMKIITIIIIIISSLKLINVLKK